MNERWMKAGETGLPHFIKIYGHMHLTTACQSLLARASAVEVETVKTGLANTPGRYVLLPRQGDYCPTCGEKAKLQA